jgi:hypothetical protein
MPDRALAIALNAVLDLGAEGCHGHDASKELIYS